MSDGRFAGVDWASEEHAVCVVDEPGRIVEGRRFRHDEAGIRALCSRLLRLKVALVALERPDGLLIERLLDAGLAVIAVHPNQVKAMRPRYSVAAGKSDGFDSFVLAELARTDSHRFRVLVPDSDRTKALRALTRAREDLVRTRVALANQLRDELGCFWPGAAKVTAQIRQAVDDHPDGATFRSLFIAPDSFLCAATMIAEIGDCRDRYPTYRQLAADSGQAPVAVESGKAKRAQFRWACDHRLREAFCVLADSSRRHNPWAADIYDRATARGASHQHAARILGRAWCQIIWRLWQDHDTYDPEQHTALQRLIAAAA
jgi:transposase